MAQMNKTNNTNNTTTVTGVENSTDIDLSQVSVAGRVEPEAVSVAASYPIYRGRVSIGKLGAYDAAPGKNNLPLSDKPVYSATDQLSVERINSLTRTGQPRASTKEQAADLALSA